MRGNGREEKHEGGGGESEKRRKRVKRGKKREVNGGISGVERGGGDTVTRKGEGLGYFLLVSGTTIGIALI